MARVDAIVLGAGIVGTSVGLHLAKRGLAVALVDRRAPGEETSYGNAGGWMHMMCSLKAYLEYGINLRAGGAC